MNDVNKMNVVSTVRRLYYDWWNCLNLFVPASETRQWEIPELKSICMRIPGFKRRYDKLKGKKQFFSYSLTDEEKAQFPTVHYVQKIYCANVRYSNTPMKMNVLADMILWLNDRLLHHDATHCLVLPVHDHKLDKDIPMREVIRDIHFYTAIWQYNEESNYPNRSIFIAFQERPVKTYAKAYEQKEGLRLAKTNFVKLKNE